MRSRRHADATPRVGSFRGLSGAGNAS
ncbi:MAG: hypothetical protein RL758_1619, partial [Pseudomonadota bacterium]